MASHPATVTAIRTLHDTWLRRAEEWQRQVRVLPELDPSQRRNLLRAVREQLDGHLRPYMQLEEGLLATNRTTDGDLLRLEHAAIARAIEHLEELADADDAPPHEAQVALALLCSTLVDHLLHEATAYLPRLSATT